MAFPPALLNENEEVVLDLRPHWIMMTLSSATLFGALVLGVLLAQLWDPDGLFGSVIDWASLGGFLVALGWVGLTYWRWATTHFVLTTDRIISREGIVRKHGIDIPLDRVNTVIFTQGLIERMVGAGDLVIESASETGANHFKNVRKPNIVQKEIHLQMEANENRKFDRIRSAPGDQTAVAAPAGASVPEQIEQLAQLHQRGVLSDAEFARKKAELLDRM